MQKPHNPEIIAFINRLAEQAITVGWKRWRISHPCRSLQIACIEPL